MTDTPAERAAVSVWTSLRRRKVVQWGLVYVAAAWGFLQGLGGWRRPHSSAGASAPISAERQHACRPSGHCGRVSRAHPRVGRYTPTPWGPPSDRHPGRAWSREHLDEPAPAKGGAVVEAVRTRRARGCYSQVLGFAADTYGWPAVIAQLAMLGLTLGLPIVVTLAWYHGDRGQQRTTGSELAVLTLLLFLSGGVLWLYAQRSAETTEAFKQCVVLSWPGSGWSCCGSGSARSYWPRARRCAAAGAVTANSSASSVLTRGQVCDRGHSRMSTPMEIVVPSGPRCRSRSSTPPGSSRCG